MTAPCDQYRPALDLAADLAGGGPGPGAPLEAHLAACAACRQYLEDMRRLSAALLQMGPDLEAGGGRPLQAGAAGQTSAGLAAAGGPSIAPAVMARIRRWSALRAGLLLAGLAVLRIADLLGWFGAGAMPRVVVSAAAVLGLVIIRANPFTLVGAGDLNAGPILEGVSDDRIRESS